MLTFFNKSIVLYKRCEKHMWKVTNYMKKKPLRVVKKNLIKCGQTISITGCTVTLLPIL